MTNLSLNSTRLSKLNRAFLVIGFLSSTLFIVSKTGMVFDDVYNSTDINRYLESGVSTSSLEQHSNPAGPLSYVWIAVVSSFMGASQAIGAEAKIDLQRIAVLLSWVLCFLAVSVLSKSNTIKLYLFSLPIMVMPHTQMAMSTLLTEGPAMMFCLVGVMLWIGGLAHRVGSRVGVAKLVVGAFLVGLSIISRQYYLMLLPALGVTALVSYWVNQVSLRVSSIAIASLAFGVIPLMCLWMLWTGFASPSMQLGTSYAGKTAGVGFAPLRAISCLLYTLIYLAFFSRPLWSSYWSSATIKGKQLSLVSSCLIAALVAIFSDRLFFAGPINSIQSKLGTFGEYLPSVFIFVIVLIAAFNACVLMKALKESKVALSRSPIFLLSSLVLVFFVLENSLIISEIGFYERYMLQVMPFIGVVTFKLVEESGQNYAAKDYALFTLMFLLSTAMLWRYAV